LWAEWQGLRVGPELASSGRLAGGQRWVALLALQ
jgi:hypothetical protein